MAAQRLRNNRINRLINSPIPPTPTFVEYCRDHYDPAIPFKEEDFSDLYMVEKKVHRKLLKQKLKAVKDIKKKSIIQKLYCGREACTTDTCLVLRNQMGIQSWKNDCKNLKNFETSTGMCPKCQKHCEQYHTIEEDEHEDVDEDEEHDSTVEIEEVSPSNAPVPPLRAIEAAPLVPADVEMTDAQVGVSCVICRDVEVPDDASYTVGCSVCNKKVHQLCYMKWLDRCGHPNPSCVCCGRHDNNLWLDNRADRGE